MKQMSRFFTYSFFLITGIMLIIAGGCKDDEDENDPADDNGNDDISHEITYGSATDEEGNEYTTVIIGEQEWMAENLKVTKYRNGDDIPAAPEDTSWENTTEGAMAVYPHEDVDGPESDQEVINAYGMLYNWYAVDDQRNICPSGWHVPSEYEWTQLEEYLEDNFEAISSSNIANVLKSCRQDGSPLGGDCDTREHPRWNGHGTHYGTDDFGFAALPGGMRDEYGAFEGIGLGALWWTSSVIGEGTSFARSIMFDSGSLNSGYTGGSRNAGLSIRCVKD
ncbi:MAG: fibrobacter succinogenes major paralogous domain-containing protein [Bacteroidales bacterium]